MSAGLNFYNRNSNHNMMQMQIGLFLLPHFQLLQYEYLQPIITQYFIDNKSEIWLLFLIAHSKRWRFNAFIDY